MRSYFFSKEKLLVPIFSFFPKQPYIELWKPLNVFIVCIMLQWTHPSHLTQQSFLVSLTVFWKLTFWFSKCWSRKKVLPLAHSLRKVFVPFFWNVGPFFLQKKVFASLSMVSWSGYPINFDPSLIPLCTDKCCSQLPFSLLLNLFSLNQVLKDNKLLFWV